jgi:hypothetical protein
MDGRHCPEQFRRSTKRRKAIETQGESIAKGSKTCCTTSSRVDDRRIAVRGDRKTATTEGAVVFENELAAGIQAADAHGA